MLFQIIAFPAPLGRSFAVETPKSAPAPRNVSNSLPATVDNPLAWLQPDVAAAIRHTATLCPNATLAVLERLCTPAYLFTLTSALLQAPLALPADDETAQLIEKLSSPDWKQMGRLVDERTPQVREDMVMKRVFPFWQELCSIRYLFNTATTSLTDDDARLAALSENNDWLNEAVGLLGLMGLARAHQHLKADPQGFLPFLTSPPPIVPEDPLDQLRAVHTRLTNGEDIWSPDFDLQACLLRFFDHLPGILDALDGLEPLIIEANLIVPPVRDNLAVMAREVHEHLLNQFRELGIHEIIAIMQKSGPANLNPILNSMMVQLKPLQPLLALLEAAERMIEEFPEAGGDHLKVVLDRYPPSSIAAGLTAFTDKRTQRNLQRSVERAARRNATAPDEPTWEQAGTFYRGLHQDSQAAGTQPVIGFVRPPGWPGFVVRWLCAQVMVSSVLAAALVGIINPGK